MKSISLNFNKRTLALLNPHRDLEQGPDFTREQSHSGFTVPSPQG